MSLQTPVPDRVPTIQTLILYPAVFSHDPDGREQAQPLLFLSEVSNSRNFPQIAHSVGPVCPDPAENLTDESCPSVHSSCQMQVLFLCANALLTESPLKLYCMHFITSPMARLNQSSIAVNRHHDHGNFYKGKHLIGAGLQVQSIVNYHHGRKRGSSQGSLPCGKSKVLPPPFMSRKVNIQTG